MPVSRASVAAIALVLLAPLAACDPPVDSGGVTAGRAVTRDTTPATYVGRDSCASCHAAESEAWSGSHHDMAMDVASAATVLGDFDDASLTHFGVTSRFTRDGDRFLVETESETGERETYEVAYAFGVAPLQQYLVRFPEGRLQTLPLAWDVRPASEGGQRWFHVYPDEPIPAGDELHWTGGLQNWNFMCAECHSTDLQKRYDAASRSYDTTYAEIDVSCEACHGPGSRHVAWAESGGSGTKDAEPPYGLAVDLADRSGGSWIPNEATGIAERGVPIDSRVEVETCARCHSRRSLLTEEYRHGAPILDTHLVAALDERLYHPDGQIDDEVYVYGSFLQSKMYAAGVTCGDCHDPHSGELSSGGADASCVRCHTPQKFAVPEHHRHAQGSPGASCVACHMPAKSYMVVDPRRDHSFRVPRPDLSVSLGTPNACTGCHADEGAEWAAAQVASWRGDAPLTPHYGTALHAGQSWSGDAIALLTRVAADGAAPGIARRSALELLGRYAGSAPRRELFDALRDEDPNVRLGALRALEASPGDASFTLVVSLLKDPVRAVRIEAARIAAAIPGIADDPRAAQDFARAAAEYRRAHDANAERPESWLALGAFEQQLGRLDAAEAAYAEALALDPRHVAARLNLADLRRGQGLEGEAESLVREALALDPDSAEGHHALGLALVRQERHREALGFLARAAELGRDEPLYIWVHAIALESLGDRDRAIEILERAHARMPGARRLMFTLASLELSNGALDEARVWAARLVRQDPEDPDARQLAQRLGSLRILGDEAE